MNKWVKLGLIGYGALVAVKTIEIVSTNRRFANQSAMELYGYEVSRDTGLMKQFNMKLASAMTFTDGSKKIVVDDSFFDMPVYVQKAILAHEEGHIVLNHFDDIDLLNKAKRSLVSATGHVQQVELDADLYAAKKVGKQDMINALSYLMAVKGVNVKELRNRIQALRSADLQEWYA